MITRTFISLLALCLGAGLTSCVKEGMSNCPPEPQSDPYIVTFIPGDGGPSTMLEVDRNALIDRPQDPVWDGHTFLGWFRAPDQTSPWDFDNDRVTSDLTLYGQWAVIPLFTVTFDSQGGNEIPQQIVPEGGLVQDPGDPERNNYLFNSWNTMPDGSGTRWDFNSTPVTEDITLYALWDSRTTYLVMFAANGGTPSPPIQYVVAGELVSEPEPIQRDGFVFGGWYINWDFSGSAWNFDSDPVTGNTILYAKWIDVFTVNFDTNGGAPVPQSQSVVSGGYASKPDDPIREGYAFIAWYPNPELIGGPWVFSVNTVDSDITLYARWLEPAR